MMVTRCAMRGCRHKTNGIYCEACRRGLMMDSRFLTSLSKGHKHYRVRMYVYLVLAVGALVYILKNRGVMYG